MLNALLCVVQELKERNANFDKLKLEWDSNQNQTVGKHMQELAEERERALQVRVVKLDRVISFSSFRSVPICSRESNRNGVSSSKRTCATFATCNSVSPNSKKRAKSVSLPSIDTNRSTLSLSLQELTSLKYRHEITINELSSKLKMLTDEHQQAKDDVAKYRKTNTTLENDIHQYEKTVNHLRTKIALVEQEVKSKQEVLLQTNDRIAIEQDSKVSSPSVATSDCIIDGSPLMYVSSDAIRDVDYSRQAEIKCSDTDKREPTNRMNCTR